MFSFCLINLDRSIISSCARGKLVEFIKRKASFFNDIYIDILALCLSFYWLFFSFIWSICLQIAWQFLVFIHSSSLCSSSRIQSTIDYIQLFSYPITAVEWKWFDVTRTSDDSNESCCLWKILVQYNSSSFIKTSRSIDFTRNTRSTNISSSTWCSLQLVF